MGIKGPSRFLIADGKGKGNPQEQLKQGNNLLLDVSVGIDDSLEALSCLGWY